MRIPTHHQGNLLCTAPAFELRLPRKSLVNIIVGLPIQQARHIVPVRESLKMVKLMLEHSLVQIPAESYIERARETTHDVDAIIAAIPRHAVIVR